MRRLARVVFRVAVCALLAGVPMRAHAQQTDTAQASSLLRIQQLVQSGMYDQARQAIAAWWRATPDPSAADAVRAHLLRGSLSVDPDSAETDYLAIVLGYPAEPQTAEALLRLSQILVLKGEYQRADGYLQRLVSDYPGSEFHGPGLLWLARADNGSGNRPQACAAARLGLQDSGSNPDLASLLQLEVAASCRVGGDTTQPAHAAVRPPAPRARTPTRPPSRPPAHARRAPAHPQDRFAVQVGAFRQRTGAETVMARLKRAGHTPRLVTVPNSGLLRVRLGYFPTAQDAADLVRRLKAQGFPAVVVGDADHEHRP